MPVTDDEHALFEQLAREAGLSVADYVRRTVLGDRVSEDGRAVRWARKAASEADHEKS